MTGPDRLASLRRAVRRVRRVTRREAATVLLAVGWDLPRIGMAFGLNPETALEVMPLRQPDRASMIAGITTASLLPDSAKALAGGRTAPVADEGGIHEAAAEAMWRLVMKPAEMDHDSQRAPSHCRPSSPRSSHGSASSEAGPTSSLSTIVGCMPASSSSALVGGSPGPELCGHGVVAGVS